VILVDSNIVIYARQQKYDRLREQLSSKRVAVSSVAQIEVMGWHLMEKIDERAFRKFFEQAMVYKIDEKIIEQTIKLKKIKPRMGLGDAIIAATALVHELQLWTANVDDFEEIPYLRLFNPLAV
jgi:predicted nucleic acid-binding protein